MMFLGCSVPFDRIVHGESPKISREMPIMANTAPWDQYGEYLGLDKLLVHSIRACRGRRAGP